MEAAIYLYNRTWHSAIGKTLFEARYAKKPNVANIRLFGSIAYIKNDKPQKLQERASFRGLLVGFSENQYKILNPDTEKVYWSRDTDFLEGIYYPIRDSLEGGFLDFNQIFDSSTNAINRLSENPSDGASSPIPSELGPHIDHVTPNQPQNFEASPDAESSEDELIRAYILINSPKSQDPITFEDSQNSPNAKL